MAAQAGLHLYIRSKARQPRDAWRAVCADMTATHNERLGPSRIARKTSADIEQPTPQRRTLSWFQSRGFVPPNAELRQSTSTLFNDCRITSDISLLVAVWIADCKWLEPGPSAGTSHSPFVRVCALRF